MRSNFFFFFTEPFRVAERLGGYYEGKIECESRNEVELVKEKSEKRD